MIRNYFKTAWRNIRRQKSYAIINIAGLAIGVAACLLIGCVLNLPRACGTITSLRASTPVDYVGFPI